MRKSHTSEPSDGIIVTVSENMYGEKGYRNWLRNFTQAMADEQMIYWFRAGNQPKQEVLYLYLCIGGKIRFRVNYAGSEGARSQMFDDGRTMFGKAWLIGCGPLVRAPQAIIRKGFRGFRYTEKLF